MTTIAPDRPHRLTRHYFGLVAAVATLLATAPLATLFTNWTWLALSAVAVAAVAGAATLARLLRAPVPLQALAMLGALLAVLTWRFAAGQPGWPLPTPAALAHLRAVLGGIPGELATEPLPAGDRDGLLLLTVLGVGVVAVLVDLLTVGLRRPAVAGLPMLAIYSVPVAISEQSIPPLAFALGAVGFLWLVAADHLDRVRRFGRRFTGDGQPVPAWEPLPLAAIGRRLAVFGALVAVVLPLAVPVSTAGLAERFEPPGRGQGAAGGDGDGSQTAVNLFASLDGLLNRDTTERLVTYTTSDPDPFYLRVGVADQLSPAGFAPSLPRFHPLDGPRDVVQPPGVTNHAHRAQLTVLDWDMPRAPIFAQLTAVSGLDRAWGYDPDQQVVFSARTPATGLSYEIEYLRREYDPQALAAAGPLPADHPIQTEYTGTPDEPRVAALVAQLVKDADGPYERARAILDHFSQRNGFRYQLETGPDVTGSAILDFLFVHRAGYCVQYAVAMAWLARAAGLPARVAIGFTRGTRQGPDSYVLTNHNLHAWTEIYLGMYGWVPFDPTPRVGVVGAVERDWAPDPDRPDPATPTSSDPSGAASPPALGQPFAPTPAVPTDPADDTTPGAAASTGRTWPWLGVILMLGLLVTPALTRIGLRRRRTSAGTVAEPAVERSGAAGPGPRVGPDQARARRRAHAAWDELLDTMIDYQVPVRAAETPRATVARLVREHRFGPDAPATVGAHLLGRAEEQARYAPTPPSAADDLATAVRTVRRALARQATVRGRIRAVALPPSVLRRWRGAIVAAVNRVIGSGQRWGGRLAKWSPRRLPRRT